MFSVVQAHNCPDHLHGYLSRFMSEIDTNLFVAKMSARVAENLWERISRTEDLEVSFVMIMTSNNEQGFELKVHGGQSHLIELDGFQSISRNLPQNTCK